MLTVYDGVCWASWCDGVSALSAEVCCLWLIHTWVASQPCRLCVCLSKAAHLPRKGHCCPAPHHQLQLLLLLLLLSYHETATQLQLPWGTSPAGANNMHV
jgi:hypothetical protein